MISFLATGFFNGVRVLNDNVAVAFGDFEPNGNMHFVRSTDKGETWTEIEGIDFLGVAYGYFKEVPVEVLKNWGVSKVATIELLVVDPRLRKSGIGRELLENLIQVFKQAGADLIMLTCPVSAREAKHLYEKLGFEVKAYHMRRMVERS